MSETWKSRLGGLFNYLFFWFLLQHQGLKKLSPQCQQGGYSDSWPLKCKRSCISAYLCWGFSSFQRCVSLFNWTMAFISVLLFITSFCYLLPENGHSYLILYINNCQWKATLQFPLFLSLLPSFALLPGSPLSHYPIPLLAAPPTHPATSEWARAMGNNPARHFST